MTLPAVLIFPEKLVALQLRNIPAENAPPGTLLTLTPLPSAGLTCGSQWVMYTPVTAGLVQHLF